METFAKLFERFLVFVYHCFDRIVIQGYMPLLTRPEHIAHFFRDVHGQYPVTPQILAKRTPEYRGWVEGLRPQPQNPRAQGEEGREQREVRPALSATDGTAQSTRGLLHLQRHGNGQHVQFEDAPVSPPTIRTTASSDASRPASCPTTFTSAIR